MKGLTKYILPLALVSSTTFLSAAQNNQNPDNLIQYENPGKITIIENSEGMSVINGQGETIFREYLQGKKVEKKKEIFDNGDISIDHGGIMFNLPDKAKKWSIVIEGLGFGLNSATGQPAGTGLEWSKSFDISWLYALGVQYKHGASNVTFGIGFDWKNFKMTGQNLRMVKSAAGGIGLESYPEEVTPKNSTLKIFSISFPLLYQIKIPYIGTSLALGPILNINTHSSLKTNYINSFGNETMEYTDHVGQRAVTLDLFGALTYSDFGLYVRYSTQKALKSVSPVNFTPLTFGIMFFL
ncbi:MAG: hypothetical protein J1E38_07560 [Paramuribaculum sp.]|nr:hypothetical protein [Paramuribaculum sp.]